MGCDFLDCRFRLEREFQLARLDYGKLASPRDLRGRVPDVTGREVLEWVERELRDAGRRIPPDCWPRVQACIAVVVGLPPEQVAFESCLAHDLGFT